MMSWPKQITVVSVAILTLTFGVATIDHAVAAEKVTVTTVQDLQEKVTIPGVIVEVAAGTYVLTDFLELAPGTDLVGAGEMVDSDGDGVPDPIDVNGNGEIDPGEADVFFVPGTETIIDGSQLTPGLQPVFTDCDENEYRWGGGGLPGGFPQPVITCQGKHRIAQLAVRYPPLSALIANAQSAEVQLDIENCIIGPALDSSSSGVRLWHAGCAAMGNHSRLTLKQNVLRDNPVSGAQIDNSGTTGTSVHVNIMGNRFTGNGFTGLEVVGGNPADYNEIHVLSIGNIYEGNAMGWWLVGGKDFMGLWALNKGSEGNRVWITSIDDAVWTNNLIGTYLMSFGGIWAMGGYRVSGADPCSYNEVSMDLMRTRFAKEGLDAANQNLWGPSRRDITIFGALGAAGSVGNEVRYLIRRAESDGSPGAFLELGTPENPVIRIGSDVAFEAANPGLDPIGEPMP